MNFIHKLVFFMSQVWLISGSPGCGKTNWILNTFKNHSGNCGYIRLGGYSSKEINSFRVLLLRTERNIGLFLVCKSVNKV